MDKSKIVMAHEALYEQLFQIRNLSYVYGFKVSIDLSGKSIHKHLILCGKKRRWGNTYKRYAVYATTDTLLDSLKRIITGGGKVFSVE